VGASSSLSAGEASGEGDWAIGGTMSTSRGAAGEWLSSKVRELLCKGDESELPKLAPFEYRPQEEKYSVTTLRGTFQISTRNERKKYENGLYSVTFGPFSSQHHPLSREKGGVTFSVGKSLSGFKSELVQPRVLKRSLIDLH